MSFGIAVTFDGSGLDNLAELLERARARPHAERAKALATVVAKVRDGAHANASAFNIDSTGELAGSIQVEMTPLSARVFSDARQGWFQEFGSPSTGGPNPWLTEPAQKGADELFELVSRSADIF